MLTQEQLRELVTYHPESGLFTWKTSLRSDLVGKLAGSRNTKGYIHIYVLGQRYKAHRLAFLYMTGQWPEDEVDHINRVRDDNRWINLRESDHLSNSRNRTNNTSGVPGICWVKSYKKWWVRYNMNHVGYYNTMADAKTALDKVIYGEQQPTIE